MTRVSFFLSLHTDGSSSAPGGFSMLTSHSKSPFVSETAVSSHLEESFDVFSELGFEDVGGHLEVLSFFIVANSVQEPSRNSLSFGVVDDIGDFVALLLIKFASSDSGVDSEDLADEETESSTNTLNLFKGIGNGPLAINVGVEDTVDVLEVGVWVFDDE